jgi:hypothetical protein
VVAQEIAEPVQAKQQNDEAQYAQLSKTVSVAPIRTGLDGGMNKVFLAQTGGNIPPARVPPPTGLPAQPAPVTADNGGPTFASRLFGGLFNSKPAAEQTKVASTESGSRGSEPTSTGTAASQRTHAAHSETAAAKPNATEPRAAEPRKGEETIAAKPKPAAQQEANAAAPPAKTGALLNGAQPVVPTGSFDSRWSGLQ